MRTVDTVKFGLKMRGDFVRIKLSSKILSGTFQSMDGVYPEKLSEFGRLSQSIVSGRSNQSLLYYPQVMEHLEIIYFIRNFNAYKYELLRCTTCTTISITLTLYYCIRAKWWYIDTNLSSFVCTFRSRLSMTLVCLWP